MAKHGIDFYAFVKGQGEGKKGVRKAAEKLGMHMDTVYKKLRETRETDIFKRKEYWVWISESGCILIQQTISCSKKISTEKRNKLFREWCNE